jgi:capsular polysaccharide export protein
MLNVVPFPSDRSQRVFLLLQGPHGPFLADLAAALARTGARILRVGFNRGDEHFWRNRDSFIPFRGALAEWPATLARLLEEKQVTDIVLYGDTRPVHAEAIRQARAAGITVHVFEEGYLRPYWVTYERDGSNGNSRLMDLSVADMRAALDWVTGEPPSAPSRWGDLREHVFYGALYHFNVLARNGRYPNFRSHRALSVMSEFRLYLQRLMLMPVHAVDRMVATRRIRRGGFPFHVVLLQLEHDSNFLGHSPFGSMSAFIDTCARAFAAGAPAHHHLVFKSHPLDDGRVHLRRAIDKAARENGLEGRVHLIRSGKLAALLNHARSAVTVNSTSAQQVLWRGLPLKALGRSVYNKPELVSSQPLEEFFARPIRPDVSAYRDFRNFLLETSQFSGSFYSRRGRSILLRQVVDVMLAAEDPYSALRLRTAPPRPHIRAVV